MEVNGFRELVNCTSPGSWIMYEDFTDLVRVIFTAAGMDFEILSGDKVYVLLNEMIDIGFVEADQHGTFVRIKKEWYE